MNISITPFNSLILCENVTLEVWIEDVTERILWLLFVFLDLLVSLCNY